MWGKLIVFRTNLPIVFFLKIRVIKCVNAYSRLRVYSKLKYTKTCSTSKKWYKTWKQEPP